MFWWERRPVSVTVKVTTYTCYESTAEEERSVQAAGHLREAERKVENRKEVNPVH